MKNQRNDEYVTQAISLVEKALELLKKAQGDIKDTPMKLYSIEKYISGSGNTTWRCSNDVNQETIYLRQSMQSMLKECGMWDGLQDLVENEIYDCEIWVGCLRDGDFWKVVSIDDGWTISG